jgi:hypothetical protein
MLLMTLAFEFFLTLPASEPSLAAPANEKKILKHTAHQHQKPRRLSG